MTKYNPRITEGSTDDLVKRRKIREIGSIVIRTEGDKSHRKVELQLYADLYQPLYQQ